MDLDKLNDTAPLKDGIVDDIPNDPPQDPPTDPPVDPPPSDPPTDPPTDPPVFDTAKLASAVGYEAVDGDAGLHGHVETIFKEHAIFKAGSERYNETEFGKLNTQITDANALVETLKKNSDPLSYFASPEQYKVQQVLKADPNLNQSTVAKILTSDLNKIDPLEIIKMDATLNQSLSSEELKSFVEEEYGIEVDKPEEWSAAAKVKIGRDAATMRKNLAAVGADIEMPTPIDAEAITTQTKKESEERTATLTAAWTPVITKTIDAFKKWELPFLDSDGKKVGGLEHVVDAKYTEKLAEVFIKMAIDAKLEPNEENLKSINNAIQTQYLIQNIQAIYQANNNKSLEALDNEWHKETNNPKKFKNRQDPKPKAKTTEQQHMAEFGKQLMSGQLKL